MGGIKGLSVPVKKALLWRTVEVFSESVSSGFFAVCLSLNIYIVSWLTSLSLSMFLRHYSYIFITVHFFVYSSLP